LYRYPLSQLGLAETEMMISSMRATYTNPFLRAFKQAPWRTQTQAVAAWSVILLVVMVLGGLYLTVASRAAAAGRDLQSLEVRKAALTLENDELRAELAELRSVTRMVERARALGFQPAQPAQIEYLAVDSYPHVAQTSPPPRAAEVPPMPENTLAQLGDWLAGVLQGLMAARVGGG
jgi:hypothetical protein